MTSLGPNATLPHLVLSGCAGLHRCLPQTDPRAGLVPAGLYFWCRMTGRTQVQPTAMRRDSSLKSYFCSAPTPDPLTRCSSSTWRMMGRDSRFKSSLPSESRQPRSRQRASDSGVNRESLLWKLSTEGEEGQNTITTSLCADVGQWVLLFAFPYL